jgi:Virulence-associated protein E
MSANDRHFTKSQQQNTPIGRLKPKRIHEYRAVWLQIKDNGYDVIPMSGKDGPCKGWPVMPNTPADIGAWKGSTAAVRMLGSGLLFIDLDVLRRDIRDAMLGRIRTRWPSFYEQCLKRHSGAVKLGLLALCATRCPRLATRYRDADGAIHMVEIFTGECKRYVCVHGKHSAGRDYGYDGRSILDVKLADLPKFKSADLSELVQLCADVMREFGLEEVKPPEKETPATLVYDIDENTRFDVHQGPAGISYADLVCLFYERRGADLRCSSSFIKGDDGTNTSKCKVSECFRAHHTIGVWDFGEGNWHLPAAVHPDAITAGVGEQINGIFGEQLKPKWVDYYVNSGLPRPTLANAIAAFKHLGLHLREDTFHDRRFMVATRDDAKGLEGAVTDAALVRIRGRICEKFRFDPGKEHLIDAALTLADDDRFDPVCEMLAQAEKDWDRVPRLERMAADVLNCEDTPLANAMVRIWMTGAVARARKPGIKFDYIPVFESPEGWGKSTALRVLAGDENFTDAHILGLDAREIIERATFRWIIEIADLAGMRKAEVETVKAFCTQLEDVARGAWGRFTRVVPRHWVMAGTTNAEMYLQSQTGNRRFWPIKVLGPIDIGGLASLRMQLWGEAAHWQSRGAQLFLPPDLEAKAVEAQGARRYVHQWEEALAEAFAPGSSSLAYVKDGFITAQTVFSQILQIPAWRENPQNSVTLLNIMKNLGWIYERTAKERRYRRP